MSSGQTPENYRTFFAAALSAMDAQPKARKVWLFPAKKPMRINYKDGEPIFTMIGYEPAKANFRKRYLPEHPIPLLLRPKRPYVFYLVPTTGNRVKVRVCSSLTARLSSWYNTP